MGTVRFRITALASALVAAVLVVTAVGLVVAQRGLLTDSLDDTLGQRADDLQGLLAAGEFPSGPRAAQAARQALLAGALAAGSDDDVTAQLVGGDGAVVTASPPLAGAPALIEPPAGREQIVTRGDLAGADGEFRVLSRRVEGGAALHVLGNLEDVDDAVRTLAASLLVAIPVVVALLAALMWWLVGATLRPVDAIQREVAGISGRPAPPRSPARRRRRDRAPGSDHEHHAGTGGAGQRTAAALRGRRVARAAQPAHPHPFRARGRHGSSPHDRSLPYPRKLVG